MRQNVKRALEKSAKQIATSAELVASQVNDWQTIQNYLTARVQNLELTPIQQAKLERYQFIYNQLMNIKYSEQDVLEMVQHTYKLEYVQALRDLRDARELFSTTLNINKLFELKALLEQNKVMRQKALDMNDMKAYAALEKNAVKINSMLPEDESSLAEEFIARQNVFQYNPELIGVAPPTDQELHELLRDLRDQYGGAFIIAGKSISDAEIIEDDQD